MADTDRNETEREIEALTAEETVTVGGETIVVRPYSWADTLLLAKPLSVVLGSIGKHLAAFRQITDGEGDPYAMIQRALVSLDDMEEVVPAVFKLLMAATKKPQPFVESLMPDEVVSLILAVVRLNRDFFARKLRPLLPTAPASAPAK